MIARRCNDGRSLRRRLNISSRSACFVAVSGRAAAAA